MTRPTLVALLFLGASCAAHPWDTAHTVLEQVATAHAATDRVVRQQMPPEYDHAEEEVLEHALADLATYRECLDRVSSGSAETCQPPGTVDDYMEDWRELTAPWREVFAALDALREALLGGEALVAAWRDSQTQPDGWESFCTAVGVVQDRVTRAMVACAVDVPAVWNTVRPLLSPVCHWLVQASD